MGMKKKINIGFHGFWKGYGLSGFLNRHPYLKKKYDFVLSDKPDFRFISVFGGEARGFDIPDNDCVNICYTGIEPEQKASTIFSVVYP